MNNLPFVCLEISCRETSAAAAACRRLAALLAAFFLLTGFAHAAPGDLDAAFDPPVEGTVTASAVQPDGRIVIGGGFTTVAGTSRNYLARLNADGTLDSTFSPDVNGPVDGVATQTDGRIIIHGNFNSVSGNACNGLARLDSDGTLDNAFNPPGFDNSIVCMAVQADGKIVLGGYFTTVGGVTRNHLARLNSDGTLDNAFDPDVSDLVNAVVVQADGKVLFCGGFHAVAGSERNYVARLNADGTLDSAFNPVVNNWVVNMALQADGKIIFSGYFTAVGGSLRNYIARLNANGTLDGAFNPNLNDLALTMAVQANGRVLIGGYFTTVGGVARNRIARLNVNGTLDGTFIAGGDNAVSSVAVQADGRVLVGRSFYIGGIVRLINDPATQALSISGGNRVAWARGGASPEVEQVTFELSTDGGNSFSPLGAGTRIAGGWERTALSLPASGEIRARGRCTGGYANSSSGLVETLRAFGSAAPELAVELTGGTDIGDGGNVNFGSVGVGDSGSSQTFTIKNTGTASLAGLTITKDGPHQGMFEVTATPSAVVPGGGSTTFMVHFAPTATGDKTATLRIASNDSDENPFDIVLNGTGALSTDADLVALSMDAGAFTPAFATDITSYAATVASRTSTVTIIPTKSGGAATITVNGSEVLSGSTSTPINLSVGTTIVSTVVTAGDGVSTKTYTLTLTRPEPGTGTGDVEIGFDPGVSPGGNVLATAVQPDGKIIIGGVFTTVAGVERTHLARLHPDGSLDSSFHPNPDNTIHSILVQADGKIVIAGYFNSLAGAERNYLARLNTDGTLDNAFLPNPNGGVLAMAMQADGKILICGDFSDIGETPRNHFARLNADGTLDNNFDPNPNSSVSCVAVQADGKVLIGGYFDHIGDTPRNYFARLNTDGTLDENFDFASNFNVQSVAVQPDGKVLVGFQYGGLARLNGDGSPDSSFHPLTSGTVSTMALQTDGKVLLGSTEFASVGNTPRYFIARLHADGTLDSAFDPDVIYPVYSVAIQADGRMLLGGYFYMVGGIERSGFARLLNGPATDSLTIQGANRVQWLRGGTSPEVGQVSFELSTDAGNSYRSLGAVTRIAGGWEKAGLNFPPRGEIRVRGRTTGGYQNGCAGLVEKITTFGSAAPEIHVKQHPGPNIADGGGLSFAGVPVGDAADLTFRIRNTGSASLRGLAITTDGPDRGMFTIVNGPESQVPGRGGFTTFTARF
ncbi:MAG: choice-of-anchor D domain-containing protein, partial [Verrucomicrobiota bacterium]